MTSPDLLRPQWSSQRAYILASVAGVVGLGNLWRFPYMAGLNNGGSFLLAYVICVFLIGIPVMVLESSAGRWSGRGPVGMFRAINPNWGPWLGWLLIGITMVIMSYYFVISGWTLGYAIDSVTGSTEQFDRFTDGWRSLWFFLIVGVLVYLGLVWGIAGVERTRKILLPALVVIVVGLAIYSLTLSGASDAISFYFSVHLDDLTNIKLWGMAGGQAFYSLSIGLGFLITYGSYTSPGTNIVYSSATVAVINSAVSITAGLMIFPIVFTFGIAPDSGSQLAFTAFPNVFGELAGGRVIAIAFFWLLFLAAFTSCFGGLTVVLAPVRDEFRISKARAALIVSAITIALGIPSALSFTSAGWNIGGKPVLDVVDQVTGSGVVLVAGIIGASLIAWVIPSRKLIHAMMPDNHDWRVGPLSVNRVIIVGRYLPVVALVVVLATVLL